MRWLFVTSVSSALVAQPRYDRSRTDQCFEAAYVNAEAIEANPLLDPKRKVVPFDSGQEEVAIVLDAVCDYTGVALVNELCERGVNVITVFSEYAAWGLAQHGHRPPDDLVCPPHGRENEWLSKALCVVSESEGGLARAETMGWALQARFSNEPNPCRRDKFLLHEALRSAGLPHCQQRLCGTRAEIDEFCTSEEWVVVKPSRGVGSEGVFVCRTASAARTALDALLAQPRFGANSRVTEVLVQSFLDGPEFAVDSVSRHGCHKICAVWKYDKRRVGEYAPRVYFETCLVEADDAVCNAVLDALNAVGFANGPAHTEVILHGENATATVVEINCRFHNADVRPLVWAAGGIDAITATAAAFADQHEWETIPDRPPNLKVGAILLHLNCCALDRAKPLREFRDDLFRHIQQLPSVLKAHVYPSHSKPGLLIHPTVDIKSDAGYVLLANADRDQCRADADFIRKDIEPRLFEFVEDGSSD